jgi:AcrR family transcriptional regulator
VSERKQEILVAALEIITDEGYASLSMRALARASGMKLGALQYHFRTWEALLRGLVSYIEEDIRQAFEARRLHDEPASVAEIAAFMLDESGNAGVLDEKLWPQLWAMEQVEPLVSDLLEEVYAGYLEILTRAIEAAGGEAPHAEALCLMSLLEGEALFTSKGRRWESDRAALRKTIMKFIDDKYGERT